MDDDVDEALLLLCVRQLAVQQQVANLEKIAMHCKLLDRIAAVEQHARVAVDVGDLRAAARSGQEPGVVGEYPRLRVKRADIDHVGADAARQDRKLDRLALPVGKRGLFRGTHGVSPGEMRSLQQFRSNWTTSPSAGSPHSRRPLTRSQSSSSLYSSKVLKAARRSPSSRAAWACRNRSSTSSFSSRPRRQLQRKRFISTSVMFGSYRALHHQFLDLADRPGRVEVLRARIDAVHDAMTAEQSVRILQVVEPLSGRLVAAVGDEPIGLQEAGRTHELVRIPPERRAGGRAART